MEHRKIQSIGNYTLTVSLPKKWVVDNNLKKGDAVVVVTERDGSLRLSPREKVKKTSSEFVIDADECDKPNLLKRMLVANYILGREIIKITSEREISYRHIKEIQSILPRLMGAAIVEESTNKLVIQGLMEPAKFPVERLVRRLHTLTHKMLRETMVALTSLNTDKARDIIRMEKDSDTVYWLILRQLELALENPDLARELEIEDLRQSLEYRSLAVRLESIADSAENIAKISLDLKSPPSEPFARHISKLSERIIKAYEQILSSFFSKDSCLANDVIETLEEVRRHEWSPSREVTEQMDYVTSMALTLVLYHLKGIAEDIARIGEITINGSIIKE
ncbi:MAG: PhoU domain-containing protein [Candidatus Geothermarchaeales archaeon]